MKQNTHKNFKNHLQQINLHSYIQYSGLTALSTVCLVPLFTDVNSTETGLKPSTPQIHFNTHSTLCSSSAKSPSLPAIHSSHSAICHTLTHNDMAVHLLLSAGLICCLLHFYSRPLSTGYPLLKVSASFS
jgi:hypothetical protein